MPTPTILVADDEPAILDLVAICLRQAGFAVVPCHSGAEAVGVYRQRHRQIAAALLDVQMPRGDGPRTLAALRDINPDLPCVFMSGNTGRYDPQDLGDMGTCRVLSKPFGLTELVDAVWQAVRGCSGIEMTEKPRRNDAG